MAYYKSAEEYYAEMTSTMSDVDISEHSLIYNALMPVCYELAYQSLMLDEATKMVFASSAVENGYGDYLEKRVSELGITRKQATYSSGVVKLIGKAKSKLPSGSKVSTTLGFTYITQADATINDAGIAYINIVADGIGSKYNVEVGEINLLPVKYEGIYSVENEEAIDNGYDEESDEELYNRYLLKVQTPVTSGNKYHYEQWALEVTGVGSAKCVPGAGNITVIIANSNKRAASEELIQEVYTYIDSVRPLLAGTLTVSTVKEITINVVANVEIDTSVVLGDIQDLFKAVIENYFDNTVYTTKKISIAKLGALLMEIDGVIDYSNLKINNGTSNITLAEDEIAIVGNVQLGVM